MSNFPGRKRTLLYRIAILTLVILIVWVISPFASSEILQIYGIDFWFRIFVTIFYGALFMGLIDIRGSMQKWKPQRPYPAPRFFYVLIGIGGFIGGTVSMSFVNFIVAGGLFGNLLRIDLIILISVILSITTFIVVGIAYRRLFNEWYEELNG